MFPLSADILPKIFFTVIQLSWAVLWAHLHVRLRAGRRYGHGRGRSGGDTFYRILSPGLFLSQSVLTITCVWNSWPWLLQFHDDPALRLCGTALLLTGTALYSWALSHLGQNYSPCYDSHSPLTLVRSGPYAFVRHPMYVAKFVVATGSWWFAFLLAYVVVATVRALHREEQDLERYFTGYALFAAATPRFLPHLRRGRTGHKSR